ncbi:hypothetical protein [Flavobacterium sp.]|uniref:hypothetical protein n=1 Tax=Flavobacterium sp. TaxID=239 RepID=UPI00286B05F0|nr:hypothetical protein [Flavobacterium sp.]
MKTTTTSVRLSGSGHKQQKNNFKRLSKLILIHFGIIVSMISNPVFANDLANEQAKLKLVSESQDNPLKKPALTTESDTIILITNYIKTIEEVIAENNKIIESDMEENTVSDIERIICEDNQIIESNITNEVFPLDFKSLNKSFMNLY